MVPRASDINSLNNCINTAVAKIFRVSFGNDVDFIRQMTGLISLRILVADRRSRFFSKLHQSSLFQMFVCFVCFNCILVFLFLCIPVHFCLFRFRPMCHSVFFILCVLSAFMLAPVGQNQIHINLINYKHRCMRQFFGEFFWRES